LKIKNSKESMSITLNYLPELNIVTVQGKFNIDNQSVTAGDILSQNRILSSLYSNDIGHESPNSKTEFQLQNLQLNQSDFSKTLDDKKLGKPYKWAQRLCGISSKEKINIDESDQLSQETVPQLIRQIRRRINARMKLYRQIQSLEIGRVISNSGFKISSILQQFVPLSYSEYAINACVTRFTEENIVNENDIFYRAILTRGSCKLECYIAVPSDFPNNMPIFSLNLSYDVKYNAENSSHLREIEGYINCIEVDNIDQVLSLQLTRAMVALDIFLETASGHEKHRREFQQDKNFLRSCRGRERSRPYEPRTFGNTTSFHHKDY
jgi:THO complex subunit 5